MKTAAFWLFILLPFSGLAAAETALAREDLSRVRLDQRLGELVPRDLIFRDDTGIERPLESYFGRRPVVLVMVYYGCPNLCTVVLNGTLESVRDLKLRIGSDFDVLVVSIDPAETPQLAQKKKRAYATRYGRPGSAEGWHFLTGSQLAIQKLADSIGFHYFYDASIRQYAHPSGLVVLTSKGKIVQYLPGIEYPPQELNVALKKASEGLLGSLSQRIYLLCFHYDPHTGKYSFLVRRVLQVAGLGTVLLLGSMVLILQSRGPREKEHELP